MNKIDTIKKFVRDNYKLLNAEADFDKSKYNDIKRDYFGRILNHKVGNPRDKEICDLFIELLIKNENILDVVTLEHAISNKPFLKMNNVNADSYAAMVHSVAKKYSIGEEIKGLPVIERIERELEYVVKERSKDIEDLIIQKQEEYRRLPSILDDVKLDEPEEVQQRERITDWWGDLSLRENPFPGPLDGFCLIDKSLYKEIIVETDPIRWALEKLESVQLDIFHRGFLLAGEFGTGKTTFYDFISSHLTMKHIEPIRIALTENISEAQYIRKFEIELCMEIFKLTKRYNLNRGGPIAEFGEARNHMLEIQSAAKGFLIFIDDLHKHTNLALVFSFLSQLQIMKNNLSRDGINVVWMVAGFPTWREKIKQDSALTGFFDAADQLTLPEVTPTIAAQAIKKRLQAFAINPSKELEVKEEFLKSIFKRVGSERGISNIGFRPYIHEAVQRFQQRQFDILSVDITVVDIGILKEIKEILEADKDFARNINKLIFGGGIKKKEVIETTLRILCEIFLRKGVTEDEDFFNTQKFYFQKLSEAGLIHKFDRKKGEEHSLVWKVEPLVEKLNKDITSKYNLSMEDYLLQIYSATAKQAELRKEKTQVQLFEQDLPKFKRELGSPYFEEVEKALMAYSEYIFPFSHSQLNKLPSLDTLQSTDSIKGYIWTIMKSIIRYESPQLLSICGENNIRTWLIRHRSLQCSVHLINLLNDAQNTNVSVADHTRILSFADESFVELWNELKESIIVYQYSKVRCSMLPRNVLQNIYNEYKTLLFPPGQQSEFFESLNTFTEMIEQSIRQYLLISSSLVFVTLPRI